MAEAEERADKIWVSAGDASHGMLVQDFPQLAERVVLINSRNDFTLPETKLGENEVIFKYVPPFQGNVQS